MDVEILEFNVPSGTNTLIILRDVETQLPQNVLYNILYDKFSQFGLLFQVSLHNDVTKAKSETNIYIIYIRYYSGRSCSQARSAVQRRKLGLDKVCGEYVRLGKPTTRDGVVPLLRFRCEELANYYIGFNGWSSRLLYHRQEDSDPLTIKYVTVVLLEFKKQGLSCEGAGLFEETINIEQELLYQRVNVAKRSIGEAFLAAWGKVLFVVLEGRKVHIEINTAKKDAFMYNPLWDQPQIQVNEAHYMVDDGEEEIVNEVGEADTSLFSDEDTDGRCLIQERPIEIETN